MMKDVQARLSISRMQSNVDPDMIRLTLECVDSLVTFVDCEIDPKEFALALTGVVARPIDVCVRGLEHVGMQRETKSYNLSVPAWPYPAGALKQIVAPYQTDGWRFSHVTGKRNAAGKQRCVFERFVEKKDD